MYVTIESLPNHPALRQGYVLDCRDEAEFHRAHLIGAVHLPLPAVLTDAALESAFPSILLPARHAPLLIVGSTGEAAENLAMWLSARGRDRIDVTELPDAGSELPGGLDWESGPSTAHLWRAPEYLVEHAGLLPPPAAGPVLDLACGSGRACVWLAERGYRVTGVDHEPEALAMGRTLARGRGTTCCFECADLRYESDQFRGPWAAILNFRYLDRDLLKEAPSWLLPGGVLMLRTFRDAPGYEGHPHPRHRLRRSELLRAFSAADLEVLCHEENHDPDGRPAAGIVIRRRSILPVRG